jgi:integrase
VASIYKRGRIWWVKFHHRGDTIRKSLKTSNHQLARERARFLETSIKDGSFTVAAACTRTPLDEALEDFCTYLRTTRTRKSAQTDIYYMRQLFGPACPAMLVNSRKPISDAERDHRLAAANPKDLRPGPQHLRPAVIEEFTTADVSKLLTTRMQRRRLSPKTVNRLREVAHRLCQWCMTQRNVRFPGNVNPVSAVERCREKASTVLFLTGEQIAEQLAALEQDPLLRAMVATLIYAGLRREELLWLTPADVDLEAGMIRVRAKTINGEYWEPKTKRNRAVPISMALRRILEDHRPPTGSPWYFPSPRGFRWDPDNFSQALRKINRVVGLPWSCLDFRHTFGSQLAQKGESLTKIAELMGNSEVICRRHYVSLIPERMMEVVEFDIPAEAGPQLRLRTEDERQVS